MKRYIKPITNLTLVSAHAKILAGSFNPEGGTGGGNQGDYSGSGQLGKEFTPVSEDNANALWDE